MIRLLAGLGLLLTACGGGHSAPAHPGPPPPAADAGAPAASRAPDAAECDRLIAHAVELGMADQRAKRPPDRVPTADQQAGVRADLHAAYADTCRQMSRAQLTCALGATTTAAFAACDAPAQDSPSSSTSNSSVAPGGITPAAPRSP